ncbi:MAG: glycoside hydrolase family 16 protein [Rubrobacter sp.]|nr:glycoside hydrolase family 16 protein [Rubrobacteraceae bacterium]MBA3793896.1 glycoside hydrolase family 16 protein [Rubrobacter sp.]
MTTDPLATAGPYEARVSVWDERPGKGGATHLANAARQDAFVVAEARDLWSREDFALLDEERWFANSKNLGRGRLKSENVGVQDETLRIRLPAGTLEGGEIESSDSYGYGSYAASIKVARAPSSLTGFFLYAPPDFHAEIDVEISNDASGRVLFTTFADGEQTNTVEKKLPFDATAAFHEYRIDLYPTRAEFSVDGRLLHTFEDGLPGDSMKLMVNAWYPDWLSGKRPGQDVYTSVDWIQR